MAFTAGLLASSAIVWVGPPLAFRPPGSSPAAVLFKSPVPANAHEASSDRLWPWEVMVPSR